MIISPEMGPSEQNKGEQIASEMYNVSDRVKQPKNHEALTNAANEIADESYDKGQRILEKNGFWHDTVREVAVKTNQAERDKKNATPLNFTEAKSTINGYAKSLAESGTREDKKSALAIESIVLGTDRPGTEGVDEALKYIEGVLQAKARLESMVKPEMKRQWDEQRAVRDALFLEKQKRIKSSAGEQQKTSKHGLSEEEIAKLNQKDQIDLSKIHKKISQLFPEEENAGASTSPTEEKINTIETISKKVEGIPTDERGLVKYFHDNFEEIETASFEKFKKKFTPEAESNFRAWVNQHLKTLIEGKPANARYPDNVASIFGNNVPLLQKIIASKERRVIHMDELIKMPFSEIAKKYLNIDLPEDYFNNFSPR